jgi:predicted protein tyrosine phosphatase
VNDDDVYNTDIPYNTSTLRLKCVGVICLTYSKEYIMHGGISAGLMMDLARSNGAMWQKELDLSLPELFIDDKYLSSVPVITDMLINGSRTGLLSDIDHPTFTANRDWLERKGYVSTERNCVNGDRVTLPFYLNGVYFEEGDRFPSASAMSHHISSEHRHNPRGVFIQNVSLDAVKDGDHKDPTTNSMLISIVDPDKYAPETPYKFREVHRFKFLDVDPRVSDRRFREDWMVSDEDGVGIVAALQRASDQNMNVIVHCHAGLYRSGAVVQFALDHMRFKSTSALRRCNGYVYEKMKNVLTSDDDSAIMAP